jgi:hypothetical protein
VLSNPSRKPSITLRTLLSSSWLLKVAVTVTLDSAKSISTVDRKALPVLCFRPEGGALDATCEAPMYRTV